MTGLLDVRSVISANNVLRMSSDENHVSMINSLAVSMSAHTVVIRQRPGLIGLPRSGRVSVALESVLVYVTRVGAHSLGERHVDERLGRDVDGSIREDKISCVRMRVGKLPPFFCRIRS